MATALATVSVAPPAQAEPPGQSAGQCAEASDPVSARREARSCGRRVELASRRGAQTQTFANPDGTFTYEASAQPRRVRRDDGSWAPIDTTLHQDASGIVPAAVTERLTFSAGGGSPLVTVRTRSGAWALSWPTALPAPVLVGDTAVYPEARPGADLRVRALPTGFTYVLAVRERAALTTLRPIRLKVTGPKVRARADGGADVVARDGSLLLSSGGGLMWDSGRTGDATANGPADTSRSFPVNVRAGDGEIVLTPDPKALADPGLTLPVYIDPQTSGRNRWAYSDSTGSDRNDGIARVGLNPDGSGVYRSFFEFPTSSVIGTRIIAASVTTVLTHSWSCGGTPLDLYWAGGIPAGVNGTRISYNTALLASLDEQWGNAHKPSGTGGCANDPQPNMGMSFSGGLTGKIQEWADAGVGATTLALSARDRSGNNESTTDRWKKFDVGATSLVIKYNSIPATPAADALTVTGTSQVVGCYQGEAAKQPYLRATGGVHLRAVLADNDSGDTLVGRFEWQDVTTGLRAIVADTPGFPSGHQFDVSLPATSLPDGHSIQWRVHGFDGTDNGPASGWCQFRVDNHSPGQPTLASTDLPVYPVAGAVVGRPATVTATPAPADTDIVGYYYGVGSVPVDPTTYIAARPGGVGRIPVVPVVAGLPKNFLTVVAVDAAGNRSPVPVPDLDAPGTRQFRADPGPPRHVRGDVTGDGRADLTAAIDLGATDSKLMNFTTGADGASVFDPSTSIVSDPHVMDLGATRQFLGDFSGDGRTDLVSIRNEGNCRTTGSVFLSTGNGYVPANNLWWDSDTNGWCFYPGDKMAVGDYNGDGKDDIAAFYDNGSSGAKLWMFLSTGTAFAAPTLWWDSAGMFAWPNMRPVAGDLNHDGKDDIGVMYDYTNCHAGMYTFLSSGSGLLSWPTRTWYVDTQYAWCSPNTTALLPGDINGDGYGDVTAVYNYGNGVWKVFTWYGPGLTGPTQVGVNTASPDGAQMKAVTGDFNGDGRTDLAHLYNGPGGGRTVLWVLYSTGSALGGETQRWDSDAAGGLNWNAIRVVQ